MKKFFTLLAVSMLAFTASADVWVTPEEAPEAGAVLVDNDLIKASTVYATKVAAEQSPITVLGQEYVYRMQVRVAAWPNADNLNGTDNGGSTPVVIEVKKPIDITFVFRRQAVSNDYKAGEGKDIAVFSHPDATKLSGEMVEVNDIDGSYGNCAEKFSLPVGTYTVAAKGTTLGLFGFVYEAVGGETPEPAEGETLTVEGSGSGIFGKTFDDYVTPFEFNVETKTLTLKNFLGGKTTVEVKFELADPNKDPEMTGTMFNSVPVSGLGEIETVAGYYKMCKINDFDGSFTLTQNGENIGKLENNIMFGVSFATNLEVKTIDGAKFYEVNIMIGGDYSKWDTESNAWVASGSNYVKFIKTIPFTTSSIDEVAVDFDENAPVEYYNLQGVRVAEPSNGVFIKRQGNKVVKVLVK